MDWKEWSYRTIVHETPYVPLCLITEHLAEKREREKARDSYNEGDEDDGSAFVPDAAALAERVIRRVEEDWTP